MLNIIDKYNLWDLIAVKLSHYDIEYYEKVFDCAYERKGLLVTYKLNDKDIKNKHKIHENKTIIKHIRSISFYEQMSNLSKEELFDMFEMESRILNEYLRNIYK